MAIHVTKQTENDIAARVRSGGYESAEEVILDGLALIEAREAFRHAVVAGEAQLDRREYITGEDSRQRVRAIIERYRPTK